MSFNWGAFAGGLADGWERGTKLAEQAEERKREGSLRDGLKMIMSEAPQPGKNQRLARADQLGGMASLYAQYGDPEKAIALQDSALKQREEAINSMLLGRVEAGDFDGLINDWGTIANGTDVRVDEGPDGVTLYTYPTGRPDEAQPYLRAGSKAELADQVFRMYNPTLARELAKEEAAYQKLLLESDNARLTGLKSRRQLAGLPTSYTESVRGMEHQRAALNDQMEQADANLELAIKSGDWEAAQATLLARDQIQQQIYGLGMGLGSGGTRASGAVDPNAVYSYLRERGVSHTHALGMLANIQGESGFNPSAVGDSGSSYGLFQHNKDRRDALFGHAGSDAPSWQQQIDYALSEPDTARYLSTQFSDPAQATEWFVREWERPKHPDKDVATRIGYLRQFTGIGSQSQQPSRAARMAQGLTRKEAGSQGIKVGTPEQLEKMQQIIGDVTDQILDKMGYAEGDTIPQAAQEEAYSLALQIVNRQAAQMQGLGSQPTTAPSRVPDEDIAARTIEYLRQLAGGQ